MIIIEYKEIYMLRILAYIYIRYILAVHSYLSLFSSALALSSMNTSLIVA